MPNPPGSFVETFRAASAQACRSALSPGLRDIFAAANVTLPLVSSFLQAQVNKQLIGFVRK
jgi:hypothetical protein